MSIKLALSAWMGWKQGDAVCARPVNNTMCQLFQFPVYVVLAQLQLVLQYSSEDWVSEAAGG